MDTIDTIALLHITAISTNDGLFPIFSPLPKTGHHLNGGQSCDIFDFDLRYMKNN